MGCRQGTRGLGQPRAAYGGSVGAMAGRGVAGGVGGRIAEQGGPPLDGTKVDSDSVGDGTPSKRPAMASSWCSLRRPNAACGGEDTEQGAWKAWKGTWREPGGNLEGTWRLSTGSSGKHSRPCRLRPERDLRSLV